MRILFIGGTGNISSECARLLRGKGHEIGILSRGRNPVPPEYIPICADRKNATAMLAGITDWASDVVLNFIGYEVSDLEVDASVFGGRVRQYIFISSATVYRRPAKLPITEDAPLGNEIWDYAAKKVQCENWLMDRWRSGRLPVTIVRPSHTYSKLWVPSPFGSSSYNFTRRLEQGRPVVVPDDGENPWTLTAASDFAVGLAGLVGNERALGEAFHITSDEVFTWNQIVATIAKAVGAPSPEVYRIPADFLCKEVPEWTGTLKGDKCHPGVFDNSKIKRFVPEFHCRKTFAEGVAQSVAWLRAHPEHQNLNPRIDENLDRVIMRWSMGHK